MQPECVMDIGSLVHIAETLENIVARCFGPDAGQVLFVRACGEILITRDGSWILQSLLLEHPAARLMVQCVLAHCSSTGDGAKSFILLLAALLRGVQAQTGGEGPAGVGGSRGQRARAQQARLALGLARLEVEVLDRVMGRQLAPHCSSALSFSRGRSQLPRGQAARVLGPYFSGKAGSAHGPVLTRVTLELLGCLAPPEGGVETALGLADECFSGLHCTVTGLPVGRTRVLEGLALGRGLAVLCQAEGEMRVLVVTCSLLPPLSQAGCTLRLERAQDLAEARAWARSRAEEAVAGLRGLGVRLLLSGPQQPGCVLELAQQHGVSVVQGLSGEELGLVRRLTGAAPLSRARGAQLSHTVLATFCRPGPLGQVLVGFQARDGFRPHCLVLCAPVQGQAAQHRDAVHGAFKLLRLLLPPESGARGKDSGLGKGSERRGAGELGRAEDETEGQAGANSKRIQDTESETPAEGVDRCRSADPAASAREGDPSDGAVPAGSVLPPGGAFEFLMHHYLRRDAESRQRPDTRAACTVVADALLNIPRHVHSQAGRGRDFLRLHADFTAGLGAGGGPPVNEGPLEVVASKRHLLISALQCLRSLLTVDRAIAVRGKLGKKPQPASEESE
ncbi:Bardet-Biedl syndrome 10 protein [Heptranchias perlo]|uniref:Bardet-Biedl syndrome 10 protein n=1 Tax=Heptranchias perlo TaxID=212740 RepID=UPI00355ABC1A